MLTSSNFATLYIGVPHQQLSFLRINITVLVKHEVHENGLNCDIGIPATTKRLARSKSAFLQWRWKRLIETPGPSISTVKAGCPATLLLSIRSRNCIHRLIDTTQTTRRFILSNADGTMGENQVYTCLGHYLSPL